MTAFSGAIYEGVPQKVYSIVVVLQDSRARPIDVAWRIMISKFTAPNNTKIKIKDEVEPLAKIN